MMKAPEKNIPRKERNDQVNTPPKGSSNPNQEPLQGCGQGSNARVQDDDESSTSEDQDMKEFERTTSV
jgi:hypothetical protein